MTQPVHALRRRCLLLLALCVMLLAGCAPPPPPPVAPGAGSPSAAAALVRPSGPNVAVDGRIIGRPTPVASGAHVATGGGSSALVEFSVGGALQLDENTDPLIKVFQAVYGFGRCVVEVVVNFGRVYVETEEQQICVYFGPWMTAARSAFVLQVDPPRAVLTVVEGDVTLFGPERMTVAAGAQVVIAGERIATVRYLGPRELAAVTAWRQGYRFEPAYAPVQPRPIMVPYLGDREVREAAAVLERLGLRLGQIVRRPEPGVRPDTVVEQIPPPGREVPPGTAVDVVAAAPAPAGPGPGQGTWPSPGIFQHAPPPASPVQPEQVRVPSLGGQPVEEATNILIRSRLALGRIDYRPAPGARPGTVVGQAPGPAQQVPPGTPVDVVLAAPVSQPQPQPQPPAQAPRLSPHLPSIAIPPAIMLPPAATMLPPAATVEQAPRRACVVPDVRQLPEEQALQRLRAAGLGGSITSRMEPGPGGVYRVYRQSPEPGTSLPCGQTVTLSVGTLG